MQMALSRGANGFRREAGGVDEPARATDVFYALSPTSPVARCSFSPVKDTGMRFAESSRPTIAIRGRKNSAAFLSLSPEISRTLRSRLAKRICGFVEPFSSRACKSAIIQDEPVRYAEDRCSKSESSRSLSLSLSRRAETSREG